MEEIVRQLKYDIQNIESKLKAIKNAENKMPNYIGRPIYKGYQESIETWKNEIKEHKKMIDIYYLKFKSF